MRFALPVLCLASVGCLAEEYIHLFRTLEKAPSLAWDDIEGMEHMGPTIIDGGINFCVYSEG